MTSFRQELTGPSLWRKRLLALCDLLPFVVYSMSVIVWAWKSKIALTIYPLFSVCIQQIRNLLFIINEIYESYYILQYVLIGSLFSELCFYNLYVHICDDPFSPFKRYVSRKLYVFSSFLVRRFITVDSLADAIITDKYVFARIHRINCRVSNLFYFHHITLYQYDTGMFNIPVSLNSIIVINYSGIPRNRRNIKSSYIYS